MQRERERERLLVLLLLVVLLHPLLCSLPRPGGPRVGPRQVDDLVALCQFTELRLQLRVRGDVEVGECGVEPPGVPLEDVLPQEAGHEDGEVDTERKLRREKGALD